MKNRWKRNFLIGFSSAWVLLAVPAAYAKPNLIQMMKEKINESTILSGADENPERVIGTLLVGLFSLLGIMFLILIISGGYRWMAARGNEEQISQAKKIIASASIGLAIVVSAYLISFALIEFFIQQNLLNSPAPATTGP